ncbi:rRNA biogenesis protein rrp5 [Clostridium sporogenes]|uniref:rRNA biogenesis protein rrp5 n=1 Tax=Clostridium sporogenes TaxID=1509 RepID=UPI0022387250|nr:rRNA biogenesis protein rrp5 [Clostridium sporogenes]MCW6108001.1 rRNA biogenesis protein rrp5 [Clostridium sporogenes]
MSIKKIMLNIVKDLRSLANNFEALASAIEGQGITPSIAPNENINEESIEKQPTLEEVRAAMAEKNREGHREEVKAIIVKHGANKLTALEPKCYADVLKEVGEIK